MPTSWAGAQGGVDEGVIMHHLSPKVVERATQAARARIALATSKVDSTEAFGAAPAAPAATAAPRSGVAAKGAQGEASSYYTDDFDEEEGEGEEEEEEEEDREEVEEEEEEEEHFVRTQGDSAPGGETDFAVDVRGLSPQASPRSPSTLSGSVDLRGLPLAQGATVSVPLEGGGYEEEEEEDDDEDDEDDEEEEASAAKALAEARRRAALRRW